MQYKCQIYWIFNNIGQPNCPKNAFRLIYIGIKVIHIHKKMSDKMLKFVNVNKETPEKRNVKKRVDDFQEIYNQFINEKAKNNLVDARNVEFHFVKCIALCIIIFQIG